MFFSARNLLFLASATGFMEAVALTKLDKRDCGGFPCCQKSVSGSTSIDKNGYVYGFENGKSCVSVVYVKRGDRAFEELISSPKIGGKTANPKPVSEIQQEEYILDQPSLTKESKNNHLTSSEPDVTTDKDVKTLKPVTTQKVAAIKPTPVKAESSIMDDEPTTTKYVPVVKSRTTSTRKTTTTTYQYYSPKPKPTVAPEEILPPTIKLPNTTVVDATLSCLEANSRLKSDLEKCALPLASAVFQSQEVADQVAGTVVACICSSKWSPTSIESNISLQSECPPLEGLSKAEHITVYQSCQVHPFKYQDLARALSLKARLQSGENYTVFSVTSSGERQSRNYLLLFGFIVVLFI